MTDKFKFYIAVAAALIFAVLLARSWRNTQRLKRNHSIEVLGLHEGIERDNLKNGQELVSKEAQILTLKELRKQSEDSMKLILKQYRKALATVKVVTEFKIDTIKQRFDVPVEVPFRREFRVFQPFYSFTGVVDNLGLTMSDVTIRNEQRIVIGDKKIGFFKSERSVSVTNSNPHVRTEGLEAMVISEKVKRFYIGPAAGLDINGNITGGLFVGYALLRF